LDGKLFIRTQNRRIWSIIWTTTFLRSELINQLHFPKFRKHKGVETECTTYNLLVFLHGREQQVVRCGYSHSTAQEEHNVSPTPASEF
jgi:hypothetical protein